MSKFINENKYSLAGLVVLLMILPIRLGAQSNGNPLFYQGLTDPNMVAVRAIASGGAFASRSGELSALFYNPAGLIGIQSPQFSTSFDVKSFLERDNQNFYPGNDYLNTSLYFEHLVTPDPAWNGIWSDSLSTIWYDSLGNPQGQYWNLDRFHAPTQGVDEYSEEAADHEEKSTVFSFNHISAAYPFELFGKPAVAAASLYRQYDVYDYDWNGAHLDPHWGTSTIIIANPGDTTRTDWSVFTRKRNGGLYSFTAALAMQLNEWLNVGLRLNGLSGTTEDEQTLDRIGYFLTKHQLTSWSFSFDEHHTSIKGTSKFKAYSLNLGAQYKSENFDLGLNIQLPYTIERKWDYTAKIVAPGINTSSDSSGTDKLEMPAVYLMGISLKPNQDITFSFDLESIKYNNASYVVDKSSMDSLTIYQKFVNQYTLRFGLEYKLTDYLRILCGYQYQTSPILPYGVAIRTEGPPREAYSGGISLDLLHGTFDVAYLLSELKYYDAYITNRNFTLEKYQCISFGYTFML